MNQLLNTEVKGWVKIFAIRGDQRELILDQKNAVLTNAKKIIAHTIGQDPTMAIDTIEVYKASGLLADQSTLTISFPPGDNIVKFSGRFDEGSFNDTLDELRLKSSIGGDFSQVTGLSVLKDNTMQIEIEWILTINSI